MRPCRIVESERVRVVVDLDPGERMAGSARREGGPPERFDGMLAFLSLLERLRRGHLNDPEWYPIGGELDGSPRP